MIQPKPMTTPILVIVLPKPAVTVEDVYKRQQVDGVTADYSFDNETRILTVPLDAIAPATEKVVTFSAVVNESAYGQTVYNTAVLSGDNIPDTEGTDAVSYTHLDVYKRQLLQRPVRPS